MLGIIIPVYNEGENIGETLEAIRSRVKTPHRVYLVYDRDDDNTLPAAAKFKESGYDLSFIKNEAGGVANAIKTGLKTACQPRLLVTMADGSDDYSVVDSMNALMEQGYDLVCGSRYVKGGKQIGGPWLKRNMSRLAGITLYAFAGIPTYDPTNSFKLYSKALLDRLHLESDSGFEIGIEVVVKTHFSGGKIAEVPCVWTDRKKGKSRFRLLKWLPKYLRWYFLALRMAWLKGGKHGFLAV